MTALPILRITLLGCLLAGCSGQLLEEVGEIGEITPPRPCSEPVKLFNTFTMRAERVAWKGDRGDPRSTLTLELVFDNDKAWPVALSNSGHGVLYAVEFQATGRKDRNLRAEGGNRRGAGAASPKNSKNPLVPVRSVTRRAAQTARRPRTRPRM